MPIEIYQWYRPLGQVWEKIVDLRTCHRYIIRDQYIESGMDWPQVIYYHLIEEDRWIEYYADEDYDEGGTSIITEWRELDPVVVAHNMMQHPTYKDRLPKDLMALTKPS